MTETQDYDKSADPTDHASNHESGGSDPIDNLGPLTGLTISGDGVITWQGASLATKYLFETKVSADTHPRFRIRADGRIQFGPGNTSPDTWFYRIWEQSIIFSGELWPNYGTFKSTNTPATHIAYHSEVDGDSQTRFVITSEGSFQWGPGNAAKDCHLSRRTSNILNTPDRFELGTLGVANSANATTPGNCQNKVEIFDAAGNSLGFIAVYDAIT